MFCCWAMRVGMVDFGDAKLKLKSSELSWDLQVLANSCWNWKERWWVKGTEGSAQRWASSKEGSRAATRNVVKNSSECGISVRVNVKQDGRSAVRSKTADKFHTMRTIELVHWISQHTGDSRKSHFGRITGQNQSGTGWRENEKWSGDRVVKFFKFLQLKEGEEGGHTWRDVSSWVFWWNWQRRGHGWLLTEAAQLRGRS